MESPTHQPADARPFEARLRIRALGVFCVENRDGGTIHAAASLRRPMAVLLMAAAAGERGITRDKLLGMLWPESSADRARHSLTQAIYNARRVTGLDDLFLTHGGLRVNSALVSSDIADFDAAMQDRDLERAVALYAGPFIDGFYLSDSSDFEQWVTAQRARYEERVVSALDELAERAGQRDQLREAVEWRRRIASLRPLDSSAAAALAVALARSGDRAGAFRHVQEHVAALKEQLDLAPDPGFMRLVDDLREHVPSAVRVEIGPSPASEPVRLDDFAAPPHEAAPVVPPAPRQSRRSWRRIARGSTITAVATIVGIASFGAWRATLGSSEHSAVPAAAPTLFVAPFSISGASPAIAYLGRGAAELLATQLDSGSDEVAIDRGAVAAAWRNAGFDGAREIPRDSVLRLAKEFSCRQVVVGSIVGNRDRTIISATLLSLPDGDAVAAGTVEGSADSVGALTSRLATKLLVAAAGADSMLAIRWHPPAPAIGAFLRGRDAYRHAEYLDAVRSLRAALRLDSTFAPAAVLLARAADRIGDVDEEDGALARAWPYRASLDDGERTELIALTGPLYPHATPQPTELAAWARIVSISPRRAASWYELGARLIREGRRVGGRTANEQATIALNHALILDPGYGPARDLLAHLTMRIDAGEHASAGAAMVDSTSRLAPFLRWRAALAVHDSATLRAMRLAWPSMNRESARAIAMASQFDAVGLDDGSRAIEFLAARATTTKERVEMVLAAHSLALITNHPAEALAQTTRLKELRPDSHGYLRLRVLDAIYGNGDTLSARDAARDLEPPADSSFRDFPMLRVRAEGDVCVLGQWRLSHGDTTGIRDVLRLLRSADSRREEQLVSATPAVCADLIEATLAVATKRRDAQRLVDRLDQLVLTSAVAGNASLYANIALARLYVELRQPDRALVTLRRRTYMAGWPAYLATVWREEAQLARATGDTRRADVSAQHLVSLSAPLHLSPLPH